MILLIDLFLRCKYHASCFASSSVIPLKAETSSTIGCYQMVRTHHGLTKHFLQGCHGPLDWLTNSLHSIPNGPYPILLQCMVSTANQRVAKVLHSGNFRLQDSSVLVAAFDMTFKIIIDLVYVRTRSSGCECLELIVHILGETYIVSAG